MKKISVLITLMAIAASSLFAQNSSLSIFSEDGDQFTLYLNGILQNKVPAANVEAVNLTNDFYNARVVFADKSKSQIDKKNLTVVDPDGKKGAVTYKIKRNKKGKLLLRYYSFTEIQEQTPVSQEVEVVQHTLAVNPATEQTTTQTTTTTKTVGKTGENENVNMTVTVGDVNVGVNTTIKEGSAAGSTTMSSTSTTTTTTTSSSNSEISTAQVVEQEKICNQISGAEFKNVLVSIEKKSFSDAKLTLAKQVAKSNCLTAMQIKTIMDLFDYEATKLEFAKYAYSLCFDPANYWKVNDAFDFESTIEELNEYIESKN